jgi:hypothetical protein
VKVEPVVKVLPVVRIVTEVIAEVLRHNPTLATTSIDEVLTLDNIFL